jgi:site-specific recombinase XerD
MANFTIYKRVKTEKGWRYQRAQYHSNGKIINDGTEGKFYFAHDGKWIPAGTSDPLKAQSKRLELLKAQSAGEYLASQRTDAPAAPESGKTLLKDAVETYFKNLENRGMHSNTVYTYRKAVDPFVANCKKEFIEDVDKQDMLDYMGWLRKQPVPARLHGNPARTMANKVGNVVIFLKAFGVEDLLEKNERIRFNKKKIVAHSNEELELLYSHADPGETFLLDFFLGTMARKQEAATCRYQDLTGTTLKLTGKFNKTRTVEISSRLAASINERRKTSKVDLILPNAEGQVSTQHLDILQDLAKRAKATFHTELHKLRKTGASRRYLAGVPLMTLMQELGHTSLQTTQIYLSDVNKEGTKKAVADADFIPKPFIVRTGTDGD